MGVAGGRPNAAVDCAVARCQLRYHAPFFTDTFTLVSCEITKYSCTEQNAKKKYKEK